MSRTSSLRKQHESIAVLAGDINTAVRTLDGRMEAERLHRLLRQLDTILTTHLASEDRLLYPEMLASPDRQAAAAASRFCEEMGGLQASYSAFSARWTSADELLADPASFTREWNAVLRALGTRIERENAELYPLADALDDGRDRMAG